MELIDSLTIEELDGEQKAIAEITGIENYKILVKQYGGTMIYFPKPESIVRELRDQSIRDEFNGGNHKALAQKYGLTETWIRSIVHEKARYLRHAPIPGQLSLADFDRF